MMPKEKLMLPIPPLVEFCMRIAKVSLNRLGSGGRFWMSTRADAGMVTVKREQCPTEKISTKRVGTMLAMLNIVPGDVLMVHSDLLAIEALGWTPSKMIDFLIDYLGPSGTLVMPTHPKLKYVDGKLIYNVKRSPSTVGLLTELFRRRKGTFRSEFPFSAVAAQGAKAHDLVASHKLSFAPHDENSPYARLAELDGKVLAIGVDIDRMTILHVAEDIMREQWPIASFYESKDIWVDDGQEQKVMRVHRRADWLWWYLAKFQWSRQMYSNGLVREKVIGGTVFRQADAKPVIEWMKGKVLRGKTIYPYAGLNRLLKLKAPKHILKSEFSGE